MPEILLASTLLIGLLAVMGALMMVVVRSQPRVAERSAQIQAGRAMIERITRELREGSGVLSPSQTSLSFLTFVRRQGGQCGEPVPPTSPGTPAIQCRVTYTCTEGTCMRAEAFPDGSGAGSPVTLVEGLNTPMEVFDYLPPAPDIPRYVTVTLEYPGEGGGESITLSDGAALRNAVAG